MCFSHTLYISKATSSGETHDLAVTIDLPPANCLLGMAHWYHPCSVALGTLSALVYDADRKCHCQRQLTAAIRRLGQTGHNLLHVRKFSMDTSPKSAMAAGSAKAALAQPLPHVHCWHRKAVPPWVPSGLSGVSQAPSHTFQPCLVCFPPYRCPYSQLWWQS